jgi:hypothetical protein
MNALGGRMVYEGPLSILGPDSRSWCHRIVRHVIFCAMFACSSAPPRAASNSLSLEPHHEVDSWHRGDDSGPECSTELGVLGSLAPPDPGARLSSVDSVRDRLRQYVAQDPKLQQCSALVDRASSLALELEVGRAGEVIAVSILESSGDAALVQCAPLVLGLRASQLGCRWRARASITLLAHSPPVE